MAQATGTVSGVIRDATTTQPIVGAQVVIVGTGLGIPTNNEGRFLIENVPAGEQIVHVEYIGYGSEERAVQVAAGGTATADLELRSEAITLEGLVATGTAGRARRREVGNSISQINASQIQTAAIADMGDVLQGRAVGVQISDNSGQVGAGSTIRLRGNNSINMGNAPLIYIDGVRMESNATGSDGEVGQSPIAFDLVNPADIARIEIVKGPAATTLYGTEAAGGVIQIFTKRGAAGAPQFTLSIDQGFHNMPHVGPDKDVNPTGLNLNDCSHEPGCPESGSWFRNGHLQRYNLSVRGGNETVSYFASGRWGRQEGVVAPQGLKEYTARANVAFRPSPNLEIQFNNMYARRDITWIPDGNNADGLILNVLRGDRGYTPDNDDSLVLEFDLFQTINHYITGIQATWNPIPSITQRLNVGLDYETSDLQDFKPWGYFAAPEGDREDDLQEDRNITFDYSGTWSHEVGAALNSSFSWGAQLYDEYSYSLNGFDARFAGPGDQLLGDGTLQDVNEDRTRIRSGGFFLQEMIGVGDRLFITGGIRWDGFSTFGSGFGLASYPKISGAYTISDEAFFPDALGQLKLRAAWGQSGKAPAAFDAARIYEATSADEQLPAVIIANLGNPDLGPETTSEIEAGFEGSLWDSRVLYDFTLYDQTTRDALICVSEPASLGTEECTLRNVGSVANDG
ncbi:MAG: TonB-dependent receptor domain-containing protein, partial [Longimicrobiales bacterium]